MLALDKDGLLLFSFRVTKTPCGVLVNLSDIALYIVQGAKGLNSPHFRGEFSCLTNQLQWSPL